MSVELKVGPLHGQVEEARAEVTAIEQKLEEAKAALAELRSRVPAVEASLKEARIAESMGEEPMETVTELKGAHQDLGEAIEGAEAKVIGRQRALDAASMRYRTAEGKLHNGERVFVVERGKRDVERFFEYARALQGAQQDLLALAKIMGELGFSLEVSNIVPTQLVHCELQSPYGDPQLLPALGDAYNRGEVLTSRVAALRESLNNL